MHGGDRVALALEAQGVPFVFTLCGGHISPILVGCKQRGIRVVDVRHEATAVFAADAVARLTGIPGVAAVTAGPGVTNTITAIKNAQLAQSPVVLLGGGTATALRGRGALQDIDQLALFRPHVKQAVRLTRVRDLIPAVERAFEVAREGVPGPVFVECPVDLLYDEAIVREWYVGKSGRGRTIGERMLQAYLKRHVRRLFAGAGEAAVSGPRPGSPPAASDRALRRAARELGRARRPLLLVGSQALLEPDRVSRIAGAVQHLGLPVYLSGMARGLLGPDHPLQVRHGRRSALREADLVLLAGVPCDFRLDYGRHIPRRAFLISANRSRGDLRRNRRPDLAIRADAGRVLEALAQRVEPDEQRWAAWRRQLDEADRGREQEISRQAAESSEPINPLRLCREIENALPDDSVLVADGGDFVGTASYIVRPRSPLSWLDPGPFGTLGVGAGFALGAKLCRPHDEVWLLYGDGSVAYSLAEFDTFVRHRVPLVAVVGNDACWMQIARAQIEILKDDVACTLRRTDYHAAAEGLGAKGLLLDDPQRIEEILTQARRAAKDGHPVLVNAQIGTTDFRKGSISI